jgi:hypothetical protein
LRTTFIVEQRRLHLRLDPGDHGTVELGTVLGVGVQLGRLKANRAAHGNAVDVAPVRDDEVGDLPARLLGDLGNAEVEVLDLLVLSAIPLDQPGLGLGKQFHASLGNVGPEDLDALTNHRAQIAALAWGHDVVHFVTAFPMPGRWAAAIALPTARSRDHARPSARRVPAGSSPEVSHQRQRPCGGCRWAYRSGWAALTS